jgi:tetratricopeptide (TPR) repeat protein
MSKPLTLLLPAIMLLLLVWPLGLVADPFSWRAWRRPLLLSLPFWALSLASAGITLLSQSLSPAAPEPAIVLGNIARTLAVYPLRALLPLELACFHPYPRAPLPAMQIAAAILFLALVTWLGLRLRRTHPCIAVGWGWYLAGIAPTLGVGQEANANRFTYLGLIGVFILVAWGWRGLAAASDRLKRATPAIAAFILAAAAILGHREVGYWRDTGTLFGRALAVTGRNHVAAFHLGGILAEAGRFAEAEARFQDVIRWNPDFAPAWHFKGALAEEAGETEAAIGFYRRALEAAPRFRPSARRLEEILGPGPVLY